MTQVKQSSQRHPIFESESSQRHLIFESESSPSLKKKVTRVDSSPSHDSDSPISESLKMSLPTVNQMRIFEV